MVKSILIKLPLHVSQNANAHIAIAIYPCMCYIYRCWEKASWIFGVTSEATIRGSPNLLKAKAAEIHRDGKGYIFYNYCK